MKEVESLKTPALFQQSHFAPYSPISNPTTNTLLYCSIFTEYTQLLPKYNENRQNLLT